MGDHVNILKLNGFTWQRKKYPISQSELLFFAQATKYSMSGSVSYHSILDYDDLSHDINRLAICLCRRWQNIGLAKVSCDTPYGELSEEER
jgi:hypothetical protein